MHPYDMAGKKDKISGEDVEILLGLFNLALKVSGVADKEFIELNWSAIIKLTDSIVGYIKTNAEETDKATIFAQPEDPRSYNNYRKRLTQHMEQKSTGQNPDGIPYTESMLNSVVFYASLGKYKKWPEYRSAVKSSDVKNTDNSASDLTESNEFQKVDKKDPVRVVLEIPDADFEKEKDKNEWMVYELAFLWHGKEPPGIQAHFYMMTREIEQTKMNIHQAVENGLLKARTLTYQTGVTRYVSRKHLEDYVKNEGLEKPDFLKK